LGLLFGSSDNESYQGFFYFGGKEILPHKDKEEANEYNRQWRKKNPEKANEQCKRYRKKHYKEVLENKRRYYLDNHKEIIEKRRKYCEENLEKIRGNYFQRKYDLSYEDWVKMWVGQDGDCAICGEPFNKHSDAQVDHDHKTGKIRGLLCNKCNFAIGLLNDDPELVMRLAEYLMEE